MIVINSSRDKISNLLHRNTKKYEKTVYFETRSSCISFHISIIFHSYIQGWHIYHVWTEFFNGIYISLLLQVNTEFGLYFVWLLYILILIIVYYILLVIIYSILLVYSMGLSALYLFSFLLFLVLSVYFVSS